MPCDVSDADFAAMVSRAIEALPDRWRRTIDHDVPVQVAPRPPAQMLAELGMEPDELLLGLYEGIPATELAEEVERVPDRIWLFKENLEDASEDEADLVEQIRITLLHELGHHFGLDEDDLARLGFD